MNIFEKFIEESKPEFVRVENPLIDPHAITRYKQRKKNTPDETAKLEILDAYHTGQLLELKNSVSVPMLKFLARYPQCHYIKKGQIVVVVKEIEDNQQLIVTVLKNGHNIKTAFQ